MVCLKTFLVVSSNRLASRGFSFRIRFFRINGIPSLSSGYNVPLLCIILPPSIAFERASVHLLCTQYLYQQTLILDCHITINISFIWTNLRIRCWCPSFWPPYFILDNIQCADYITLLVLCQFHFFSYLLLFQLFHSLKYVKIYSKIGDLLWNS